MKIYTETNLSSFEFWSGAADRVKYLTENELNQIESILEQEYPEGIDKTALNDLFWFDFDTVCEWIGTTEDEVIAREEQ